MMVSTGSTVVHIRSSPKMPGLQNLWYVVTAYTVQETGKGCSMEIRQKRLRNMSCVNDAFAFASTVLESWDKLGCLDWDHVSFIQKLHLSVAIAFKALHCHNIWIAGVPKPDTARGGEVYRHILNDVKIHTLLFHDVILLSCKMRYNLKIPSVYSSLLLPEDKMGYGHPWASWFLRIIASLASLHSHISLCSELEELPAPGWGLDEWLWQWVLWGIFLPWVNRNSPAGSWDGWKGCFEIVSLASIGNVLCGLRPMPVYILLCISRRGGCGAALLVDYTILKKSNKHVVLISGVFFVGRRSFLYGCPGQTQTQMEEMTQYTLYFIILGFNIFISLLHLIF